MNCLFVTVEQTGETVEEVKKEEARKPENISAGAWTACYQSWTENKRMSEDMREVERRREKMRGKIWMTRDLSRSKQCRVKERRERQEEKGQQSQRNKILKAEQERQIIRQPQAQQIAHFANGRSISVSTNNEGIQLKLKLKLRASHWQLH